MKYSTPISVLPLPYIHNGRELMSTMHNIGMFSFTTDITDTEPETHLLITRLEKLLSTYLQEEQDLDAESRMQRIQEVSDLYVALRKKGMSSYAARQAYTFHIEKAKIPIQITHIHIEKGTDKDIYSKKVPENILAYLPKDRTDIKAIKRLEQLGYPTYQILLGKLCTYTEDMNWPIAQQAIPLLLKAKRDLIPYLKEICLQKNADWIYTILDNIVQKLPVDVQALLAPELVRFAKNATPEERKEGVDTLAQKIVDTVKEKGIPVPENVNYSPSKRYRVEWYLRTTKPSDSLAYSPFEHHFDIHLIDSTSEKIIHTFQRSEYATDSTADVDGVMSIHFSEDEKTCTVVYADGKEEKIGL